MSSGVWFQAGGLATDDRGSLRFINDLLLDSFKRFYLVKNHSKGFVRAWHGHKHESKAVIVLSGAAVVAAVKIVDWDSPALDSNVERFVLSGSKFGALHIPAGYANGFMTLTDDAILMFLSSSTLEESAGDDYRYPARHWDPWQVVER